MQLSPLKPAFSDRVFLQNLSVVWLYSYLQILALIKSSTSQDTDRFKVGSVQEKTSLTPK